MRAVGAFVMVTCSGLAEEELKNIGEAFEVAKI